MDKEFPANDAICVYRNALPDALCDDIVELFNAEQNQIHLDTSTGVSYYGASSGMHLLSPESTDPNGVKTPLDLEVFERFNKIIVDYQNTFKWLNDCPEMVDSGYRVNKYVANKDSYREHIDGDPWSLGYQGRICGVVMYLNDVIEGGETYFPLQNVGIKPVKGTVAMFPANWTHPHEALPPVSNDKYIIATFLSAAKFRHKNNYFVDNASIYG